MMNHTEPKFYTAVTNLLRDTLDQAHRNLVKSHSLSLYEETLNRVKADEKVLKDAYVQSLITIDPKVESEVKKILDRARLVSPVFVKGKLLLQDLWEEGVEWDEVLSLERQRQAQEILEQFESVEILEFERGVIVRHSELHVFADISSKAYGAVAYVRDAVGDSQLLTSRMQVTPCKQSKMLIPKLELLALMIAFRLVGHLFGLWNFACVVMWTNGLVAKTWVETKESSHNCFISNRVGEILFLQRRHEIQLKYVPTKLNPADILT
ncbi:uncharacterized protein [Macrobrachium rosenbergii]|uniref:uncharacterized protein n=1 Tax=Macrobrachium rosenbergii TaxID=79674 RepID=UPI0034D61065